MGNLWLKIKFWTKLTVAFMATMFIVVLLSLNWNAKVYPTLDLVVKKYEQPNFLLVTLCTSVTSILGWWLIRTGIKTVRQFRAMRDRSKTGRLERELTEMKAKAAKLQTRPETPAGPQGTPPDKG